jgi:hypothetical protein
MDSVIQTEIPQERGEGIDNLINSAYVRFPDLEEGQYNLGNFAIHVDLSSPIWQNLYLADKSDNPIFFAKFNGMDATVWYSWPVKPQTLAQTAHLALPHIAKIHQYTNDQTTPEMRLWENSSHDPLEFEIDSTNWRNNPNWKLGSISLKYTEVAFHGGEIPNFYAQDWSLENRMIRVKSSKWPGSALIELYDVTANEPFPRLEFSQASLRLF